MPFLSWMRSRTALVFLASSASKMAYSSPRVTRSNDCPDREREGGQGMWVHRLVRVLGSVERKEGIWDTNYIFYWHSIHL